MGRGGGSNPFSTRRYNAALDYAPMTNIFNATAAIAGSIIPIALNENGPIPDPDQLQSTGTKWLYFNTWTAPFPESSTCGTGASKDLRQQLRHHTRRDA
jgi:hypothetical protein